MTPILFKNSQKVETLKKYLYSNRLSESEIDRRLTEFGNDIYIKGFDHGCIVQKNVAKRISDALNRIKTKHFDALFETLDEEQAKRIFEKNK